MFTVATLISLEVTLVRATAAEGLRFACFMVLIMVWSALRCDDLQCVDPASLTLSQLGLKFTLPRSKTSGPGKKLGTLQGFVLRTVSSSGYDWISAGMSLLKLDAFSWPRDFLCVDLDSTWEAASREFLDAEGRLIPSELVNFCLGHSARHVLPSLAAAIGISEDRINFIGRWAAAKSASSTYIQPHTS